MTTRYTNHRASGNAHQRLKGRALQNRNLSVNERDGYCCRKCGIATTSGEVDHIKALENGGTDDMDNLQYLCVDCHKVRTGTGINGYPTNPKHHWI